MSLLADVLWECTFYYLNMGLYLSLAVGVMILLRPVANRLLTPGQRLFLWGSVWLAGYVWTFMDLLGRLPFPISLRQLVTPRTGGFVSENLPAFLPVIREAGTYNLALPGGTAVPFQVSQGLADHLWLLAALYWLLVFAIAFWEGRQVKRLTRGARELTGEDYDRLRLTPGEKVEIRLCPALPTSFVVRGGKGHVIYLQQELPPEQMKLVLLHEREHTNQHHPWLQGLATATWAFYFWNPLVWLAYSLFRRDMELSCDRGVMDRLDEEGRREYARTLVELASDKPVWGGLTSFGECDAAIRVKRAAGWHWRKSGWLPMHMVNIFRWVKNWGVSATRYERKSPPQSPCHPKRKKSLSSPVPFPKRDPRPENPGIKSLCIKSPGNSSPAKEVPDENHPNPYSGPLCRDRSDGDCPSFLLCNLV